MKIAIMLLALGSAVLLTHGDDYDDYDDEECEDEGDGAMQQATNPPPATTTTVAATTASPDAGNCEKINCNFESGTLCGWVSNTDYGQEWKVESASIGTADLGVKFTQTSTNRYYAGQMLGGTDRILMSVDGLDFAQQRFLKLKFYVTGTKTGIWVLLNENYYTNAIFQSDEPAKKYYWTEKILGLPPGTKKIFIYAYGFNSIRVGVGIDDISLVDSYGRSVC